MKSFLSKKMLRLIVLMMVLAMSVMPLASCGGGGREKTDISAAKDLKGLAGATLAAQSDTFHLTALKTLSDSVTVKEYPDFTQLLTALKSGAIDGYVAEEPTAFSIVAQNDDLAFLPLINNSTGFTATDEDTGIAVAFRTGDAKVAQVNAIIAGISQETRSKLMEQIVAISTNPDAAYSEALALASTKTVADNAPVLKIAMECAYEPFNWSQMTDANGAVKINGSTLYANGFDVQIAKYIAAELGMKLEIVAAEWEALIVGLNAGTFDGIIAGMSPTAEREEEVDFTDCYYNSNLVIIYKK
jgi:ABC-type amino acid transport substrate-binding protein